MPIITLTTDWGIKDYYVGVVKGKIYSQIPQARIVDISHEVPPFDILKSSFLVKNAYPHFPEFSFHYIGVANQGRGEHPVLLLMKDGHYFIGSDSGLFSLIFSQQPDMIVDISSFVQKNGVLSIDAVIEVIKAVYGGGDPYAFGEEVATCNQLQAIQPVVSESMIKGNVIYIDHYGNIITNISRELFDSAMAEKNYYISFGRTGYGVSSLSDNYSDVPDGERLALFNSAGYLQLSLNKGKAASLLGLRINDTVLVEFR